MKILIVSDSHGRYERLYDLFSSDNYRAVIFAGDGLSDAERLYDKSGASPVYKVRGNCDIGFFNTPDEQFFELAGKKIFLAHGHTYAVKSSPFRFEHKARSLVADVAIFGHTHSQFYEKRDSLILLNPGSLAFGKYAVMTITQNDIQIKLGDYYND